MSDAKPYTSAESIDFDSLLMVSKRIHATVEALEEAQRERDVLAKWQLDVAEAMGFVNRPEGQGGYEVASVKTIIAAWDAMAGIEAAQFSQEDRARELIAEADARAERAEAALAAVTAERDALKAELSLTHQKATARMAAILYTIGGEVEGMPTQSINFLERLRQLVRAESALKAAIPILEDEVKRTRQSVADWPADTNGPPTLASDEAILATARAALASTPAPDLLTRAETEAYGMRCARRAWEHGFFNGRTYEALDTLEAMQRVGEFTIGEGIDLAEVVKGVK